MTPIRCDPGVVVEGEIRVRWNRVGARASGGALLLGALLLALAACGSEPKEPLRIGVNVWPPFELLYLARARGYFDAEKVDVDLVDFSSPAVV